jgi:hypothetical protein
VTFVGNRIYRHKVIRINHTTYDGRRNQDSLNPRTHADFMVLAHEDDTDDSSNMHPYWYGRIIGVFHACVKHTGPASKTSDSQQVNFLWVRWFGRDLTYRSGFKAKRLPRIGFIDSSDAFGFVDPREVIRGVHLIPAFAYGKTSDLLSHSIARNPREKDLDWNYYYVNMWVIHFRRNFNHINFYPRMVDRDMFMRYHGGGIGHQLPRDTTDLMEKDADWEDILDDEDSEVVDDREPNRDVDKNEKTEQGKTAASD